MDGVAEQGRGLMAAMAGRVGKRKGSGFRWSRLEIGEDERDILF
jgi:hypothetical protein